MTCPAITSTGRHLRPAPLPAATHAGFCGRVTVQAGFYPRQIDTIVQTILTARWLDPQQRAAAAVSAIRGAVAAR